MRASQFMGMGNDLPAVHVVDDSSMMQDAVKILLGASGLRCQTYSSARAFLDIFHERLAGCLLLDVRMPGMSGLELQHELNRRHSVLPIVFMTGHNDVSIAVSAMQSGAVDFIVKPFNDKELLQRIDKALQRDSSQRQQLHEKHAIWRRMLSLSGREREIMDKVVSGVANKVIAADLDLSQRTVEIHRARVMEKMHATSLAHLVRMVIAVEDMESDFLPASATTHHLHKI